MNRRRAALHTASGSNTGTNQGTLIVERSQRISDAAAWTLCFFTW